MPQQTNFEYMRERLLRQVTILEQKASGVSMKELLKTEWSSEFEQLMRNRLLMGSMRYGRMGSRGKPQYDRVNKVIENMKRYQETGNLEYLVDSANTLMLEFVEGNHPNKHFHSKDDEEHTELSK